jgi:hypothetical protein
MSTVLAPVRVLTIPPTNQLIRDKLFTKYNGPSRVFLHLDQGKIGSISQEQFCKVAPF